MLVKSYRQLWKIPGAIVRTNYKIDNWEFLNYGEEFEDDFIKWRKVENKKEMMSIFYCTLCANPELNAQEVCDRIVAHSQKNIDVFSNTEILTHYYYAKPIDLTFKE